METKSSLPCSQQSATRCYPMTDQSSPRPTSYLILSSHLRLFLPKSSLSPQVTPPNPVYTSPVPHTCHMPRPSSCSWYAHPHNIWWSVQIKKLLVS